MARGKRNFIPGSKKEKISLFHIFSKGYFQTVELTKKLVTALMLSSIVIIFSGLSGVYLYTRRVNTPFVVLVDRESGDVINSKVLEKPNLSNIEEKQIEYFISKLIIDSRSVPLDKTFYQKKLDSLSYFLTKDGGQDLKNSLKKEDVKEKINSNVQVTVDINNIAKLDKNKYQVMWTESTFKPFENMNSKSKYIGIIEVRLVPVKTKEMMKENPFGIMSSNINISKSK